MYQAKGDTAEAQREFAEVRELHRKADEPLVSKISDAPPPLPQSAISASAVCVVTGLRPVRGAKPRHHTHMEMQCFERNCLTADAWARSESNR